MLDFPRKTYNIVTYSQLDDIVKNTFANQSKFNCISYYEWNNDCVYEAATIDFPLSIEDIDDLQEFADNTSSAFTLSLNMLLTALAVKGVIPTGNYLIDVSW